MVDISALQGPAGQLRTTMFFVGPLSSPLHPFPGRTNEDRRTLGDQK